MAQAPPLMQAAGLRIDRDAPGAVFSGIVGDAAHGYGYHLAPNQLNSSDYSMQLSLDKGAGVNRNFASALDISLTPAQMKAVTSRLRASALDPDDDRMQYFREFYGTLNGSTVFGLTHNSGSGAWSSATSDSSHLWHVHLSFFRKYANSAAAMEAAYSLFTGGSAGSPTSGDDMIGLKKGDTGEKVDFLQRMLGYAGFPVKTVDGKYGADTASQLLKLRKASGSSATSGDSVTGDAAGQVIRMVARAEAKAAAADAAKGPKGDPGPAGPAGKPGADGKPGTLPLTGVTATVTFK